VGSPVSRWTTDGWYLLPEEIPCGLTVVEGVVMDILPTVTTVEAETPAAVSRCCSPVLSVVAIR